MKTTTLHGKTGNERRSFAEYKIDCTNAVEEILNNESLTNLVKTKKIKIF